MGKHRSGWVEPGKGGGRGRGRGKGEGEGGGRYETVRASSPNRDIAKWAWSAGAQRVQKCRSAAFNFHKCICIVCRVV